MSISGKKCAIISLGMSCQTSYQIIEHANLLKGLLADDTIVRTTLPFDWLIAPMEGTAEILKTRKFVPEREELVTTPKPIWRSKNVVFWHEFAAHGHKPCRITDSAFDNFAARQEHKAENLQAIARSERLVCVVSNTQNNLARVARQTGTFGIFATPGHLSEISAAASAYFGRMPEFMFVTRRDRFVGAPPPHIKTYYLEPGPKSWKGDHAQWARVFIDYFH